MISYKGDFIYIHMYNVSIYKGNINRISCCFRLYDFKYPAVKSVSIGSVVADLKLLYCVGKESDTQKPLSSTN